MSTQIKFIDRGANRLVRAWDRLSQTRPAIEVGALGSKAAQGYPGGVTVADVLGWAEMGAGQPARPWLRGWIDANLDKINETIGSQIALVLKGKISQEQAMERIGLWLQGELQANISSFPANGFPALAPATIKRKGSSTPLIDTGQARSAITFRVRM